MLVNGSHPARTGRRGRRGGRGFGREQGEAARFVRETDYMVRQEILAWWWSRGVEISWQILIPVASAALLVYGGSRIVGQTMTLGDLMMFSAYLLMLLGPLEALAASATRIQSNLAGFDRILDLLDEPREFADSTGHVQVDRAASRGGIEIESVWFAYPRRVAARARSGPTGSAPSRPARTRVPTGGGREGCARACRCRCEPGRRRRW